MRSRELKLTIPIGVLKAICIWPIFYKIETIKNRRRMHYRKPQSIQSIDERLGVGTLNVLIWKRVNNYATLFINLNDSIKTVRSKAKNQFAKIKYDSEKNNFRKYGRNYSN
jgi:hypothetical protein